MTNFGERKTCVRYSDVINLGFSESSILAEVGNKAFKHNFDCILEP